MKLYKMIEIYLKYDNMHTIRTINAFICINNHVNSCINSMLSTPPSLNLLLPIASRLISGSTERLEARFRRSNRENSPLGHR